MKSAVIRFFSHECSPLEQFIKYAAIGVISTLVQMAVFYALATTLLKCLDSNDWAVKLLSLPSTDIDNSLRGLRFFICTAIGFSIANIFCWIMNRLLVFKPGKYRPLQEFLMFFGIAATAMIVSTLLSSALIKWCAMMTTLAAIIEIAVSLILNFAARKFFIFKG